MLNVLFYYLIIINLVAFILYGLDKWFSIKKKWRIRESFLLLTAVIGGPIGAIIGMVVFHHKVSKIKFRYGIPLVILAYAVLSIMICKNSRFVV